MFELLDGYFRVEGAGRMGEGRYLSSRATERDNARQIVARLAGQLPELGMLTLVEETLGGGDAFLVLRTLGAFAVVPEEALEYERLVTTGAVFVQRFVHVRGLVEAANRLLSERELPFRFLPMASPEDAEAYLAVDQHAAQLLDGIGFWDEPLADLLDHAGWPALPQSRVA